MFPPLPPLPDALFLLDKDARESISSFSETPFNVSQRITLQNLASVVTLHGGLLTFSSYSKPSERHPSSLVSKPSRLNAGKWCSSSLIAARDTVSLLIAPPPKVPQSRVQIRCAIKTRRRRRS